MADLTERAVIARVPSIIEEKLGVLARREPVTVPPGTSLADCLRAIQRTGTGDSVFVTAPDDRLLACSPSAMCSGAWSARTSAASTSSNPWMHS